MAATHFSQGGLHVDFTQYPIFTNSTHKTKLGESCFCFKLQWENEYMELAASLGQSAVFGVLLQRACQCSRKSIVGGIWIVIY